jgi:murein DD-endopeptidase MepM/ murein hydrolase activator NlpD
MDALIFGFLRPPPGSEKPFWAFSRFAGPIAMNRQYFIVVLAHSMHGRLRRFHIDHRVVYGVLALALVGCFSVFGILSSYMRMAWKVANYNSLRQETQLLRDQYKKLSTQAKETDDQLAQLKVYASEVSLAYGIRTQATPSTPAFDASRASLTPTYTESLAEYDMLKGAKLSNFSHSYSRRWLVNVRPQLWPLIGPLLSHFGKRQDPFEGNEAFHSGLDIKASTGTPVHASADGIVKMAGWMGGYGKLVVIDHGRGYETYYGHLSRIDVIPGQEVRAGQSIAASGSTGRSTAPHLHYEVRIGGQAQNPSPYLTKSFVTPAARKDFGF